MDLAAAALKEAQDKLDTVQSQSGSAKFLEIEATLAQARITFQNAKTVLDLTSGGSDNQSLRDEAQIIFDDAKIALEDAQKEYDDELNTEDTTDILEARARVVVAQEIYDNAVDNLRALQTGAESQSVITAGKVLDQAKAALDQAAANIKTAEANLALLDAQMKNRSCLTISVPIDPQPPVTRQVVFPSKVKPFSFCNVFVRQMNGKQWNTLHRIPLMLCWGG